ncbi:hypothetical protein RCL_jg23471.t1 [Rhizophagus clarus]|uniref:Uncharacterized protein n=1 Tax=Rhizophagus clarus TaxID=94130 RepID=A0A8H3QHZ4_9GLOM|nr:hypothetical protein RCL_jg23471.t1 [Rhizophagus clarus]
MFICLLTRTLIRWNDLSTWLSSSGIDTETEKGKCVITNGSFAKSSENKVQEYLMNECTALRRHAFYTIVEYSKARLRIHSKRKTTISIECCSNQSVK